MRLLRRIGRESAAKRGREVVSAAGGEVHAVDNVTKLRRFVLMGCEGGSFYAGEQKMTADNAAAARALIDAGRGLEV